MTLANPGPGRPRPPTALHMVVTRELTADMRQLRIAAGESTKETVAVLNATIRQLYPDIAEPGRRAWRGVSVPREISEPYVSRLERGYHSRPGRPPDWLVSAGYRDAPTAQGSKVPAWLVRAYDVAFGADGYLVDVYRWAQSLLADHQHNPPRITAHRPDHVVPGHELDYLSEGFADAPVEVAAVLRRCAEDLRRQLTAEPETDEWVPSSSDGSGSLGDGEEENPEGRLVHPGEFLVMRWVLHNTGSVPWRSRYLFRIGMSSDAPLTPRLLAIPDTDPGSTADIRCPVRAPLRPGTYRLCMKMGWPDGTYCFPNTMLGVILSLVVPPADIVGWGLPWPRV